MKNISIIGVRGFPADFVGTSGLEFYAQNITQEIISLQKNCLFLIYCRSKYQLPLNYADNKTVKIKIMPTLSGKWIETTFYSFLSSVLASFDKSSIVWYHGLGSAIFSFLPRIAGKKIILTIHSFDWARDKWNFIEKYIFYYFSKVSLILTKPFCFSVSTEITQNARNFTNLTFHYAPPGIDLDSLSSKNSKAAKYLLYVGRVVPEKRLEWLLEYAYIRNKKVIIAGGHGNMENYEIQLKKKYESKYIIWKKYIFGAKKRDLIKNAQVVIIPSKLEGFSILMTEAIGLHKYIVIAEEFVDRKLKQLTNIITFEYLNKNLFIEAVDLAEMQTRKSDAYSYKKNELDILKKYNWRKSSLKYLKIINQ